MSGFGEQVCSNDPASFVFFERQTAYDMRISDWSSDVCSSDLNLDEVIHLIRTAEEPKAELMARFRLTEVQADAILNMRLRALHKLQEIEIRREHDGLTAERDDLEGLLASGERRWQALADQKIGRAHV